MYIVTLYRKWIGVVERNACLVSTFHQPKICRNIIPKHKLYDIALVPFRKSHTWIFWQVVTHSWSNQREPNGLIRDKFSIIQPWEKKKTNNTAKCNISRRSEKDFSECGWVCRISYCTAWITIGIRLDHRVPTVARLSLVIKFEIFCRLKIIF